MRFTWIDYGLWLAAPLFQIGIVIAMLRRGLSREYPYFLNYTIFQIASTVFLLCVGKLASVYYYGYWATAAISAILSLFVLWEVLREAVRSNETLRGFGAVLFRWLVLVVVLASGVWAVTRIGRGGSDDFTSVVLVADRGLRMIQLCLAFLVLLASDYVGISRRQFIFGVALGLALVAAVNLLMMVGLSHRGFWHPGDLRRLSLAAYDIAALVWLSYATLTPLPNAVT